MLIFNCLLFCVSNINYKIYLMQKNLYPKCRAKNVDNVDKWGG